jgi:hypothetical protein
VLLLGSCRRFRLGVEQKADRFCFHRLEFSTLDFGELNFKCNTRLPPWRCRSWSLLTAHYSSSELHTRREFTREGKPVVQTLQAGCSQKILPLLSHRLLSHQRANVLDIMPLGYWFELESDRTVLYCTQNLLYPTPCTSENFEISLKNLSKFSSPFHTRYCRLLKWRQRRTKLKPHYDFTGFTLWFQNAPSYERSTRTHCEHWSNEQARWQANQQQ